MSYPYGHPFWLGKPTREELIDDSYLGLLDAIQSGHVFLNGIKGTPCHCDSYMTIFDYNAFDKVFEILNTEFNITKEEWSAFADYWINHINAQPMTKIMGLTIKRKIEKLP